MLSFVFLVANMILLKSMFNFIFFSFIYMIFKVYWWVKKLMIKCCPGILRMFKKTLFIKILGDVDQYLGQDIEFIILKFAVIFSRSCDYDLSNFLKEFSNEIYYDSI